MGENYPHESLKLFSQSVRGCGIIHVGFLSVVFDTPYYTGLTERKPLPFSMKSIFHGKRGNMRHLCHHGA
jgi:hypothetical protein